MNTIQSIWKDYCARVYPSGVPIHKEGELKRTFYASALGTLALLSNIADQNNEEAGAAMLEGLHQEALAFVTNELIDALATALTSP